MLILRKIYIISLIYENNANELIDKNKKIVNYMDSLFKQNKIGELNNPLLVPYETITEHGLLECYPVLKIYINNIGYRKRVLIGLIDEVGIEGAECLLNSRLLERI